MGLNRFNFQEAYKSSAKRLEELVGARPKVLVIAGSGLKSVADKVAAQAGSLSVPYGQLPGHPVVSVDGHDGKYVVNPEGNVLIASGRVHFYEDEGFSPSSEESDITGRLVLPESERFMRTIFPAYLAKELGIQYAIVTDLAGALRDNTKIGDLILVDDFARWGKFPDMTEHYREDRLFSDPRIAYDTSMRELGHDVAELLHLDKRTPENKNMQVHNHGTFVIVTGPTFETQAELDMMRNSLERTYEGEPMKNLKRLRDKLSNPYHDVVGMAGVPESLHMALNGIKVLHIALPSDYGFKALQSMTTHEENLGVAAAASDVLALYVHHIVGNLVNNPGIPTEPGLFQTRHPFSYQARH